MSAKLKVRDEHALADRVRHAMRVLSAARTQSDIPDWVVGVALDAASQEALVSELTHAKSEDLAVCALASLSAQHLYNTSISARHQDAMQQAAVRLGVWNKSGEFDAPVVFTCVVFMLWTMRPRHHRRSCLTNADAFFASLNLFQVASDTVRDMRGAKVSPASGWHRLSVNGIDAVRWASALVTADLHHVDDSELRTNLVYEGVCAMLRVGVPEIDAMMWLTVLVGAYPEMTDALLALCDFTSRSLVVRALVVLCMDRPEFCASEVVAEWTSDAAWCDVLRSLNKRSVRSSDRPMVVNQVVLNHLAGRDVRSAMEPLLALHPLNMDVLEWSECDKLVADDIDALSQMLGRELVPTRLGWAS